MGLSKTASLFRELPPLTKALKDQKRTSGAGSDNAEQLLQQTGHTNEVSSSISAVSRVSRLLGCVVSGEGGKW